MASFDGFGPSETEVASRRANALQSSVTYVITLHHTRASPTLGLDVATWPVTSTRRENLEHQRLWRALLNVNLMSSIP